MTDIRTLGEIAANTAMLTVSCLRCERRGGYRLDKCSQRESPSVMERCDILVPELLKLFLPR